MFSIDENNFLENGVVKYLDESGNRLVVTGEKDGSAFKLKIKPKDETLTIKMIKLEAPFNTGGINFDIERTAEEGDDFDDYKEQHVRPLLENAIEIAARWVQIETILLQISPENFKRISSMMGMSEEESANSAANMLYTLAEFEETKNYGKLADAIFDRV